MKKLLSLAAVLLAAVTINAQIAATCAEAAAAMPAEKNATTAETYIVTGYITETNGTISKEQQCFWMDDEKGSKKTIQGYWCNLPEGEKDKALKVGDKITVTGKIMNYNNTPEIKNGDVAIIERAEVLPVDTISVTQALARLAEGKTGECYIKGKVSQIFTSGIEQYGNISYWMHDLDTPNDSIQAYRMFGANNQKYTSSADIEFFVGDDILVYATGLQNYHNKNTGVDVPETTGGYFFRKLGGKPTEKLDWSDALAVFYEDHWQLEISKNASNVLILQISSDKKTAIGGHHYLAPGSIITINGTELDITSGFIQLTYKEFSTNGYNVYTTQLSAVTDEKVYTIAADLEFMSVESDYETEIDLVDDRPFQPTEDNQEVTCEQARSYTLSLEDNQTSEWRLAVHGYVTDLFADGQSFWMADTKNGGKVIEAYYISSLSPATQALAVGTEVIVTGKVQNYVKNDSHTPEIKNGKVQIISGGVDVEAIPVSVAKALEAAKALANSQTSTEVYAISGFIASIETEYSEKYGNLSFKMSDKEQDDEAEFIAYNVACDASLAELLVPGTKVTVTAKVTHFHQNAKPATDTEEAKPERDLYETAAGGVVVLYGTGVEDIMVDVKAAKFIYEGQLYIINGNAIYNVQGQRVK